MLDDLFEITQLVIKTRLESWSKYTSCNLSACHCELLKKQTFMPPFLFSRSLKSSLILVRTNICIHLNVTILASKIERKGNFQWANYETICWVTPKVKGIDGYIWNFEYLKFFFFFFHSLWIFGTQNPFPRSGNFNLALNWAT